MYLIKLRLFIINIVQILHIHIHIAMIIDFVYNLPHACRFEIVCHCIMGLCNQRSEAKVGEITQLVNVNAIQLSE